MSKVRGRGSGTWISSRMRPGRAVITNTRSPRNSASSMSCVTKRTVFAASPHTRRSSSPISDRVWASSAPKGSSISSTSGSFASARAMATRCIIPPDSSFG